MGVGGGEAFLGLGEGGGEALLLGGGGLEALGVGGGESLVGGGLGRGGGEALGSELGGGGRGRGGRGLHAARGKHAMWQSSARPAAHEQCERHAAPQGMDGTENTCVCSSIATPKGWLCCHPKKLIALCLSTWAAWAAEAGGGWAARERAGWGCIESRQGLGQMVVFKQT